MGWVDHGRAGRAESGIPIVFLVALSLAASAGASSEPVVPPRLPVLVVLILVAEAALQPAARPEIFVGSSVAFCTFAIRIETGGISTDACCSRPDSRNRRSRPAAWPRRGRRSAASRSGSGTRRPGPDQLAEIDPALGQIIDDDPLAAEEVLHVDQLHFEPQPVDVLLADVEPRGGPAAGAAQFIAVLSRHFAEDCPAPGSFSLPTMLSATSHRTSPTSRPRSVRAITAIPRR